MDASDDSDDLRVAEPGVFEARYLAFLETITHLRPKLHRYCARMTGSVLDGEDVVQDALFQAYRKLDTFEEDRPLAPWLFRIAHNRCIDFLRRREVRQEAEAEAAPPESVEAVDPPGPALGRAVEHLVLTLPPKERACVLLKDVFDYSLEEIAELVDSTVGGVKAALNRGRAKLAASASASASGGDAAVTRAPRAMSAEASRLLQEYVDRFNQRDWDGLRALIASDARIRVADRFAGKVDDSPYFSRYARLTWPWRIVRGDVDGEPVIIQLRRATETDRWIPNAVIRLDIVGDRVTHIVDYSHCPWLMQAADVSLTAAEP